MNWITRALLITAVKLVNSEPKDGREAGPGGLERKAQSRNRK